MNPNVNAPVFNEFLSNALQRLTDALTAKHKAKRERFRSDRRSRLLRADKLVGDARATVIAIGKLADCVQEVKPCQ